MSSRRILITGIGPISGLGIGAEPNWAALEAGESSIDRIEAFDPSGFACRIGASVRQFKVRDFVPKTYRKATKVMARDIELAVAAADLAAHDAKLATPGSEPGAEPSYPSPRLGAHIGAGLIAADLDELTTALAESRDADGRFDMHAWGESGMTNLTPLWLLKYLPNMLACHVTIIHDAQGPSNTITCNEASGALSVGESLRVIQRGMADACFCGGTESKLNLMGFLRQQFTGRLNTQDNDTPQRAVRPFSRDAAGTVLGEGGAILVIESAESFEQRAAGGEPYAEVAGFGASQTVDRKSRNMSPDPEGRSIAAAIRAAMREAQVGPDEIDLIVPFGSAEPAWDCAEARALARALGDEVSRIPITATKAFAGNCGPGASALDLAVAAKAIREQRVPPAINCDEPIEGLNAGNRPAADATIRSALCYATGIGGQNAAIVLKRIQ